MAYPGPPRRASGLLRYILVAVAVVGSLVYFRNSAQSAAYRNPYKPAIPSAPGVQVPQPQNPEVVAHPIDTLIAAAGDTFDDLLKKESHDLNAAAAEYRRRRGRHPPPGFDTWFKFAQENGAVMVEDFFDQIYHDLGPFWGLPPANMRKEAWDYEMVINIRRQNATAGSDWFWTQMWLELTQTIQHLLPDMDIPVNAMDEPRVVVPWEHINEYMRIERASRKMPPPSEVISEYQGLPEPGEGDLGTETRSKEWEDVHPFWDIATRGCHPDSLARKAESMDDFSHTPSISLAHTTAHTYRGYVSNYSLSTDFCHQPDLQSLHGMMIQPLSVSTTRILAPLFGGSKLPTNNEILLPAPMYWANEERFSGGDEHGAPWYKKLDKVIWRGVATGGRNEEDNWKGFQRHRFVAMTNSTQVSLAESWSQIPVNWAMPTSQYNLAAQQENRLGEWVNEWSDTGFVDLMCSPAEENGTCSYTSPYYDVVPGVKMAEQFQSKYLPDIDGNSFSGRYRGFLLSTSLPIKATIFREWHDSRLVPWKHFVPMDNRFMDFYGIMQYFLGYEGEGIKIAGHDRQARRIAEAGQDWANKVLRREDMQIYVLRLLLEYARLGDDRRDYMGYVGDLL
ncbi:hypothetical protein B7494_g2991 [Chlorociboria aeruginascens]|nr:hypothetical protein B7494_g2991 [Chlorociboria aeruginascens]